MKIFKKSSKIPVSAIRCGDVFEFEDEVYIKTDQRKRETGTPEYVIAVSLGDGLSLSFNPGELVEHVHGSFVIGEDYEETTNQKTHISNGI